MRRSYPLLPHGPPTNHWDWYFLMQHYDLPTRLLDWSESSLVGLFFAVFPYGALKAGQIQTMYDAIEKTKEVGGRSVPKKAAVWMMDPGKLNQLSLGEDEIDYDWPILRHDDEAVKKYLSPVPGSEKDVDGEEYDPPPNPIAIKPPCTNPRLTAQRGMFVLFGFDGTPLERMDSDWQSRLRPFEISPEVIADMRSDLR